MDNSEKSLRSKVKIYLVVIIIGLVLSGITAFPLATELEFLLQHSSSWPKFMQEWLGLIYLAIKDTNEQYPYLSYGIDWLAFAHIMLAVLFVGPLVNPIKNKWVIQFGIICCVSIIPLALIAGHIRQIPLFWQMIDCSFGIIAIFPLSLALLNIKKIESISADEMYI